MLFFIQIETSVPADTPEEKKEDLRKRELARACELIALGQLRRIWRIVGKVGAAACGKRIRSRNCTRCCSLFRTSRT